MDGSSPPWSLGILLAWKGKLYDLMIRRVYWLVWIAVKAGLRFCGAEADDR